MKTDTGDKILQFIKEKAQVKPKEIIGYIGFGAPAVFRQLKKLQNKGLIEKSGTSPNVYYHLPMSLAENFFWQAFKWLTINAEIGINDKRYCRTRDVFQARQDRLPKELVQITNNEQLSFLVAAVVGEIGNNSFDHNLGKWRDIPGIIFEFDTVRRIIVLADRGQGVKESLRKIRPEIASDEEALQVAFTEIVSGRAPESRGNGLKFVRKVFLENNLRLNFYSGWGCCKIRDGLINFSNFSKNIPGVIAVIEF